MLSASGNFRFPERPAGLRQKVSILPRPPGTSSQLTERELAPAFESLLVDRLQLRFHQETKDMPACLLVIARNGPKLIAHSGDAGFDVSVKLAGLKCVRVAGIRI